MDKIAVYTLDSAQKNDLYQGEVSISPSSQTIEVLNTDDVRDIVTGMLSNYADQIKWGSSLSSEVFIVDKEGLRLGSSDFASAPFSVTMAGDVVATSLAVSSLNIPDADTTANSFHTDTTGNSWWGATTTSFTADNNNANAYILKTGEAKFQNFTGNGSVLAFQNTFGDGSDGDVDITSGTTTLTRDMFYDTLTISSGAVLETAGFRVFCSTALVNAGTIRRNGVAGSNGGAGVSGGGGGAGGSALASGSVYGSPAGKTGGDGSTGATAGPGVAGSDVAKGLGVAGVAGGDGGVPSGSVDATGGAGGSLTGTVFNQVRNAMAAYYLLDSLPSFDILRSSGGSGSGGGGKGSGTKGGGGGGSGSGGGILVIFARSFNNTGTISANGGNGGDGGQADSGGGGGGGAGGSGGVIIYVYSTLVASGTLTMTGGTGGTKGGNSGGGTNATNGATGTTGVIIALSV